MAWTERQHALLQAMGLRRVSAVLDAPRAALIRRFGPELLHYLDQLSGRIPENLTLYLPPEHFDQKVELSFGAESTESLLFPLKRLTSDLAAFVSGRDAGVQCFALHLEHEGHPPTRFAVGLLSAERDPVLLFEHARARLERVAVAAPVIAIRLLASDLPAFVPAGRHLFEKRTQQMMAWPQLRERLRSRLGDEAVHALDMHPDHRPEYATRRIEKTKQYVVAEHSAQRPTWLLSRPVPLRDSSIEVLSGPERLETGWWDGDDVRRDYYIVQTSSGQQAWVFCPVGEQGPYMLHGWFA